MKESKPIKITLLQSIITAVLFLTALSASGQKDPEGTVSRSDLKPPKTVSGLMQARPGGPLEEVSVAVHEVPVNPPSVIAQDSKLQDDDLVLGIVVAGIPMAYPIRYISLYEVVDDRVGETPVAPTW